MDGKKSAQVDEKPFSKMQLWFSDTRTSRACGPPPSSSRTSFTGPWSSMPCRSTCGPCARFPTRPQAGPVILITYRITRLQDKLVLDWKPLKEQFGRGSTVTGVPCPSWPRTWPRAGALPKLPIKLNRAWLGDASSRRQVAGHSGQDEDRPLTVIILEYQGITSTWLRIIGGA